MTRAVLAVAALMLLSVANAAELRAWTGGATPPLALEDLEGRTHSLADYRGKVVLVNFWATWCEPCRAEMPSMERLRAQLSGQRFAVLGVNMAEPLSRIEKFTAAVPVGFTLLRDRDGSTAKAWRARVLPASFLVDGDGRVRYYVYGELDWASEPVLAKVRELLRASASSSTTASARRSAAGENKPRLSLKADPSWR